MIKNLAGLECKIEEEVIKLVCGSNCPLTHIKEALFQFLKHIGQIEDMAKKQQEAEMQKAEEKPCCEGSCESQENPVEA